MGKFDPLALLGILRPLVVEVLTIGYQTVYNVDSNRINCLL